MNMKNTNIRTGDIVVTFMLIIISLVLLVALPILKSIDETSVIEIYYDGNLVETFDISEDRTFEIEERKFAITVKNGVVQVSKTHCRDKSCTRMKIDKDGGSIICLPGKIVVSPKHRNTDIIVAG